MSIAVSALIDQFSNIGIDPMSLSENLLQMVSNEMDPDEYITDLFAKENSSQKFRFGAFGAMLGSKDPLKRCIPVTMLGVLILLTSKRLYTLQQKSFLVKEKVDKMDFCEIPRPLHFYIKGNDVYFIIENDRSFVIDWVRGLNPIRFKVAMDILGIEYWPGGK